VIDVDSPGGGVFGVEEAANAVYAARGSKPIVALADVLAASAADWIATQADELVVAPSGEVGASVYLAHTRT
jgi:ClpP class serine protease